MKPWRASGTLNLQRWALGSRVRGLDELKVGAIILCDSLQFDAHNLARITRLVPERKIAYGVFVKPGDPSKHRAPGDQEFAVHEFELEKQSGNRYYHVGLVSAGFVHHTPDPDDMPEPLPNIGPLVSLKTKSRYCDWLQ